MCLSIVEYHFVLLLSNSAHANIHILWPLGLHPTNVLIHVAHRSMAYCMSPLSYVRHMRIKFSTVPVLWWSRPCITDGNCGEHRKMFQKTADHGSLLFLMQLLQHLPPPLGSENSQSLPNTSAVCV